MPARRSGLLPVLLLAAALASGCAGPRIGRTVDAALPEGPRDTIEDVREFGPFYERVETASGAVRTSYRPLLHTRIDSADGTERLREVLWPVYTERLQDGRLNWRFLCVWGRDADVSNPASAWNLWAFPFWFQGRTPGGEDYAALFPLGGTLRNFLLLDRFRFILFPLWAEADHHGIHSTYVLWPIFSRAEGQGHHNLRVFPFWGHVRKDGEWDRRFILWPLWNQADYFRDGRSDGSGWMLIPVAGHIDRPTVEAWHVLPPFFQVSRGRGRFDGDRQILAPWPLVRVSDVRGLHKRHFFPFYAATWDEKRSKTYVLWPFYRHDRLASDNAVRDDWSFAPIFHRTVLRRAPDAAEGTATNEVAEAAAPSPEAPGETLRSYTRLWPLFSYVDEQGGSFFRLLDLSWQRRVGAMERNLLQMPVVYTHGHDPASGTREDELLWGLFRWRRDADATRQFQLWPLFRRERAPFGDDAAAAPADWSLGCGLLGRETDAESGERLTRLLWFLRF